MYIVAGLGNPGREYENTRHNVGFCVIDELAKKYQIAMLERKHRAVIGRGYIDGQRVILLKPLTYMNLSGESIREAVNYYKVDESSQLVVISDDISLDVGQLRIRKKGSAGGHNGLKNIIGQLGHENFIRIRMGVSDKPQGYDLRDYVLGHFTDGEKEALRESCEKAADAVRMILRGDVDGAMNRYNAKKKVQHGENMEE
ncbi:MAG: aminoacyl-tRNA hydrolase [bacterium]|nr:aminoacyl-tRNA hydrolase [bacterium]MCM1375317.1 aminoacyl-tRNA hydrolase [Muribaculum sp.]MCM1409766.1 aminoacyl-tRNA hydrolase [Lachnospiraceae bacterium]